MPATPGPDGDLRERALFTLLALNGLRITESLNADIDDLSSEPGHRTLAIVRKGDQHCTIPNAPRTGRAPDLYIGERTMGPIFLGVEVGRIDRYCADRMVKRLVEHAGIDKRISPHSLRYSFTRAVPVVCSADSIPARARAAGSARFRG